MTERLYYTSDVLEGTAHVVSCRVEGDNRYAVALDKTLFHPQGGGQPADRGWISGIEVNGVVLQGENVVHYVSQPLPLGEVSIRVDAGYRMMHTRLHSAGHMIGCAGEYYGWRPVKAHHWPGEGRITFSGGDNAAVPGVQALEERIALWQSQGLLRHIEFEDGRRKVRFGDLPAYGCGGTHVVSLSELGSVAITSVKVKKGQLIVNYHVA